MSRDVTLVFYGMAIEAANDDANDRMMGSGQHPAQIAARSAGLEYWWGSEFPYDDLGYLLLGRKLAVVGIGWDTLREFEADDLLAMARDVDAKLREASLGDRGRLIIRVESDH